MKPLTLDQCEVTLECLPEDTALEGNLCAHDGDDACYAKVREQIRNGNDWAWCIVKVTVAWKGWRGTDYLGACSYASEADFRQPGGYFDDMCQEALAELNKSLANAKAELDSLEGGIK